MRRSAEPQSFDAYRVDLRTFWKHGGGHVLAVRQYNWLTSDAPSAAQATVILRGYKQGQYLSPYMSSLEVEERLSFNPRWGATLFGGAAGLYGEAPVPLDRSIYPTIGAGLQFVIKPQEAHDRESRVRTGHRRQPGRLSEAWLRLVRNFDILDFELSNEELAAIDALDTGVRGGPDPERITLERSGRPIPEA